MQCTPFGICLGAPRGIASVGCWTGTGFLRSIMQYMHMMYMYQYKRYVGDLDICICYIASVQNPVPPHLAFASARLMALRRLVAGRALDFEEELCSICICIYMMLKPIAYSIQGWSMQRQWRAHEHGHEHFQPQSRTRAWTHSRTHSRTRA